MIYSCDHCLFVFVVKVNVHTPYKGEYFEITNEIIRCFWILLGMLTDYDFAMNFTFDFHLKNYCQQPPM